MLQLDFTIMYYMVRSKWAIYTRHCHLRLNNFSWFDKMLAYRLCNLNARHKTQNRSGNSIIYFRLKCICVNIFLLCMTKMENQIEEQKKNIEFVCLMQRCHLKNHLDFPVFVILFCSSFIEWAAIQSVSIKKHTQYYLHWRFIQFWCRFGFVFGLKTFQRNVASSRAMPNFYIPSEMPGNEDRMNKQYRAHIDKINRINSQ